MCTRDETELPQTVHRRPALALASALALLVGLTDLGTAILFHRTDLASTTILLGQLAGASVAGFAVFLILWYLVGRPLCLTAKLVPVPLALSLSAFLLVSILITQLSQMIPLSGASEDLARLIMIVVLSAGVAAVVYLGSMGVGSPVSLLRAIWRLSVVLSAVLAWTITVLWLFGASIRRAPATESLPVAALFAAGFAGLVITLSWIMRRTAPEVILYTFLIVTVGLPFIKALSAGRSAGTLRPTTDLPVSYVILIIVDTLRADHLSCYGQDGPSTPNIDRLALDGALYRHAISPSPWTLPSVASVMSGLSPFVHQTTTARSRLPLSVETLAERMGRAGYYTAAYGYNPFLRPESNMSQGFQEYYFPPELDPPRSLGGTILRWLWPSLRPDTEDTGVLTDLTCEWLLQNYGRPFFMWVHYYDPHLPYSPPADFLPPGDPAPRIGNVFDGLKDFGWGISSPPRPKGCVYGSSTPQMYGTSMRP